MAIRSVFWCTMLFVVGCKPAEVLDPSLQVVATAYREKLTLGDLQKECPAHITGEDSAVWSKHFIADWQQRRTLVHLAQTELPDNERDFENEVTRYREALYIHAYEDRFLRDHLDTAMGRAELQGFLDEQPDLFRLGAPLFRARWLVFPNGAAFPRDIRDLQRQLASNDAEKLSNLSSRCTDAGMPHELDAERWWTWAELGQVVPLEPRRDARQQSSNRVTKIEWQADTASGRPVDQRALLLITQRLNTGDISPVERVANRIGELLLHRRRDRTLVTMRQKAVEAAWAEAALSTTQADRPDSDTP